MKSSLLCLLLAAIGGNLSAATSFSATGVSADLNVADQHTLAVSITGTFVATIVLEQKLSGAYRPLETWTAGVTYKPPNLTGIWRLRCSDYTSGTATYTLTSVANNQVIYRKPDGTTAFSVDVDGLVTSSGGAVSGGTIDNTVIGGTTPAAGTFTSLFATAVSGPTIDNAIIGGTTPAAAAFTTASVTGAITSTLATGTAPLTVASTTKVTNLNADTLDGLDWRAPGTIGGTTPGAASFTTVTGSDTITGTKDGDVASLVGSLVARNSTNTNRNIILGVTTADVYFIQANLNGTGSRPLTINSGGGNVLIGTTTDDGTNKLQVSGTANVAGTTEATTVSAAALIDAGGLGVAKRSFLGTIGSTFKGNVNAGVQDGTSAAAGQVGEVLTANTSTYTNLGATATYAQLETLALTAGDWDVHATVTISTNSATMTANADSIVAIATATASATGAVEGKTLAYISQNGTAVATGKETVVLCVPLNISATTNYFLNAQATYTAGGPPQYVSHFWARRLR